VQEITTLVGDKQALTGGPVASQEAIKELGTNGGGFYNATPRTPSEPQPFTDWLEVYLLLGSRARCRDLREDGRRQAQGYAILAVMALIWPPRWRWSPSTSWHSVSSTAGHAAGA